jgi:hypothetical protein
MGKEKKMFKNFIGNQILQFAAKRLNGYRSQISGIGFIFSGFGMIVAVIGAVIRTMFPDQAHLPEMEFGTMKTTFLLGCGSISTGFAVLGIGGKHEKTKAAINAQTEAINKQNALIEEQNRLLAKGPEASPQ